jgi:hypothetical protein|tara:strand:+ start:1018 stop:1221 length:204 start_codon:yes stop_codon:yes gene_type:complete
MKLQKYLSDNKLTQHNFLDLLYKKTGTKLSQGGLSKYIKGQRIPRKNEMKSIHEITEGKVQPNDFYL